jgi:hypothetical protein
LGDYFANVAFHMRRGVVEYDFLVQAIPYDGLALSLLQELSLLSSGLNRLPYQF